MNKNSFEDNLHEIISEIQTTLVRKNHDYGDSFAKQFEEYGLTSSLIRLDDKMNRLKSLRKNDRLVEDESIEDTVLDLVGYGILTLIELNKNKG